MMSHVISARSATSSVHAQSRHQCMIATGSVHAQSCQALNHDPEGRPPHAAAGISGPPCAHLVEDAPILAADEPPSEDDEDDWPSGHDTPSPLDTIEEHPP